MDESEFNPKILVLCCSRCAYASADLTGIARIRYPPGVRIVRVLCSGRVDPYFVLRAFEKGLDGVMIAGCHPGECFYISGNVKAERRMQMLRELLAVIGINPRRLRFSFLSASTGGRFAEVITDFVDEVKRIGRIQVRRKKPKGHLEDLNSIIRGTAAFYCAECGKCTSICPVSEFSIFSPRVTIGNALLGFEEDTEQSAFDCITCGRCNAVCPAVVDYPEFTRRVRRRLLLKGYEARPSHGNLFLSSARIMSQTEVDGTMRRSAFEGLNVNLFSKDKAVSKRVEANGTILYFTGCFPLYRFLFKDVGCSLNNPLERIGDDVAQIPRDAVFLMNRAGVTPTILEREKCCGHDLYWIGDEENFKVLADYNASLIKESGAKRVVCSCPEGYWTLKNKYPEFTDFDVEVLHISEFLKERVEGGELKLGSNIERGTVTYQDPCRLGRYLGVYDAPRFLLEEAGFTIKNMKHSREIANCCGGPNAWVNCGSAHKMMQMNRLEEAKATGAAVLVTACPKCQAHLKCGMYSEPDKAETIEIKDLVTIVAEVIRNQEGG